MAAEEAKDPKRSIPIAYTGGILTLVALAVGVMVFAGGAGDWSKLANINDPLPQAMKIVVGESSGWLHMLVWLGIFGLVASFHGIILGYSRQIYAQARSGYLPAWLAKVHPRFKTPHRAILAGGVIGIAAIFSDEWLSFGGQSLTANIVTMSVFGALLMYVLSMAALFKLRRSQPRLARPYKAPFYPCSRPLPSWARGVPGNGGLVQPLADQCVRGHPRCGLCLLPTHPQAAPGIAFCRTGRGRILRPAICHLRALHRATSLSGRASRNSLDYQPQSLAAPP